MASQQRTPEDVLRMQLVGSNPHAQVKGAEELPGKANYFIGNGPAEWRTDIPTYASVQYQNIYSGVNLVYYGTRQGDLEYDFVVAPGADPRSITLGIETPGRAPLRINAAGDLVVALPSGDVQFHKPVVYQEQSTVDSLQSQVQGEIRNTPANPKAKIPNRKFLEGHYALDAQNRIHFELGPYDHNRPLVIDPVLLYSTYIGGSGGDIAYGIAVDDLNDAYITGVTNSTNFPTGGPPGSPAPYQSANKGTGGNCFATELNNDGTKLLFSTYIGGSGADTCTALAMNAGALLLTGYTTSQNFPAVAPISTALPYQQYNAGGTDAFVTELAAQGNALTFSTYLGGSADDYGLAIAGDSMGNAYVVGSTLSSDFPVAAPTGFTAFQPHNAGSQDGFITKVNSNGESLVYSTYLGGTAADVAQGIQLDSSNNAYVTGYTFSTNFPVLNPLQSANGGGADAFVTELNPTGSALVFSTYLGGSGDDRATGIALDKPFNIYIVGETASTNFPTTSPVFQPSLVGSTDAFVTKINNAGSQLLYSTYLGGSGVTQGTAIAVAPTTGIAYVTGFTQSSQFPAQNAIQSVLGLSSSNNYCGSAPCADVFLTEFTASGSGVSFSTYLGGNGPDFGEAITLDSTGDPYLTGSTSSTNFPATTVPVPGTTYVPPYKSSLVGTAGNAFIAKMDPGNGPNISINPTNVAFGNETISVTSPLQPVTIFNPSTSSLLITAVSAGEVGSSTTVFTVPDNCVGTINPGATCTMYVAFTPNTAGSVTDQITITDNAGNVTGTQQIIDVTGTGVTAATAVTVAPSSLSFANTVVGQTSLPQSVTITNTGSETLNITNISTGSSNNFAWTSPSCLAVNNTLNIGQSCTVNVTFTPTGSNTEAADLEISDNATGSPQQVALTGTGVAAFSLEQASAITPVIIGSTQATFTVEALSSYSFTGAITLSCSSNVTCSFGNSTLFANTSNSTLVTVSNLSANPPSNPLILQVTGTSGSQSFPLQVNLQFADFTLTPSPSVDTIQAGATAGYTITVNPLFGFNQQITLVCYAGMPDAATCVWNPTSGAVTPNGTSPASVGLSITTEKYVPITGPGHTFPRLPGGKLPPLIFGLLSIAGLAFLIFGNRRRSPRLWLGLRMATLSLILALNLVLAASCRANTLVITGTTTGNYTIQIQGTLTSNTSVVHYCQMALSVTASPNQ